MKHWGRKLACITKMATSTNYIKSLGIFFLNIFLWWSMQRNLFGKSSENEFEVSWEYVKWLWRRFSLVLSFMGFGSTPCWGSVLLFRIFCLWELFPSLSSWLRQGLLNLSRPGLSPTAFFRYVFWIPCRNSTQRTLILPKLCSSSLQMGICRSTNGDDGLCLDSW